MKICVLGLWHLGSVTAACLAAAGHNVVGLDYDPVVIDALLAGRPPVDEPGLPNLIAEGLAGGRLRFTTEIIAAISDAEVVWVTYDTPVDENDVADVGFVVERIERIFGALRNGMAVVVSSQLPVGSVRSLEERFAAVAGTRHCHFAASPENLRLGQALSVFQAPDRIIVGVRDVVGRAALEPLMMSISSRVEWMSVESAEMTKHAINAFLATSITFANEIAGLCEHVGADAREVARGLKTEARIGPGAYLMPGGPFAGGTLARDIGFLTQIGRRCGLESPVIAAVKPSNDSHRGWASRALTSLVPKLDQSVVAILGLVYKEGTDTLRRSAAVELAEWLTSNGAQVRAYDPALRSLPKELSEVMILYSTVEEAISGADAVVLATGLPALQRLDWNRLIGLAARPAVVDASGIVAVWARSYPGLAYAAVGFRLGL